MSSKTDVEAKLREFLDKHGQVGFLKLLLTNYLFELAMYYLHSEKNPAAQIREDTSYRFYVDGQEKVYAPEEIERFRSDLRIECKKKAAVIVENLREMGVLDKLGEDITKNPAVAEQVQKAFESITQRT
jgi:hypothetical protein